MITVKLWRIMSGQTANSRQYLKYERQIRHRVRWTWPRLQMFNNLWPSWAMSPIYCILYTYKLLIITVKIFVQLIAWVIFLSRRLGGHGWVAWGLVPPCQVRPRLMVDKREKNVLHVWPSFLLFPIGTDLHAAQTAIMGRDCSDSNSRGEQISLILTLQPLFYLCITDIIFVFCTTV